MLSRRAFLQSALIASSGAAVGATVYDLRIDGYTGSPVVEHLRIRLPNLPEAFHGYRIGFLTDIHLGMWVPHEWIHHAIEVLQKADVDILLLGGDYIFVTENPVWRYTHCIRNSSYMDLSKSEATAKIFREVGEIFSSYTFRDGTIGVVGNHEHWNSLPLFTETMKAFPKLRFLINEEVTISRNGQAISLLGVDDFLTGLPTVPPPRSGTATTRILMSHNPDYVANLLNDEPSSFDLALCGHTHGGQVRLPGVGGFIVQVQDPRFVQGLVKIGDATVYTSRGLGVVGLPFRVNCPPEITIFELEK
jgi:predicted MPP superfamily phosphohydrolase